MMRMLGLLLLIGSLLMIGSMLVRFGTATVARASDGGENRPAQEPQAVLDLSNGLARTVKYVVVPAALLLLGGVLLRSGRTQERAHELRVETGED
jgi:hypothetical protein